MKKRMLKLSVLFVALFIGVVSANAYSIPTAKQCQQTTLTEPHMDCGMYIEVAPDEEIVTGQTFKLSMHDVNNIMHNEITVTMQSGWELVGLESTSSNLFAVGTEEKSEVVFEIKYVGTDTITGTTVQFATGSYDKNDEARQDCGFKYSFKASACDFNGKYYFDKNGDYIGDAGDAEAEAKYYADCYSCKKNTDEGSGGNWHGLDGRETTEDEYYKQCMSCLTPDNAPDGKYHGLNGKETDEAGYKKECTKYCKTPDESGDGKYYCKDGEECTEAKYKEECLENPKSGSFIPYAGIAAGVILIVTSTLMVKKQTKLRKI